MAEYKFKVKETLKENMPCWVVEITKDGRVEKTTTLMSEGGCIKWAGEQIMRMQRADAKVSALSGSSWVEETFGKK